MRKKYYNLFWLESVWINRRAFSLRESLLFLVELNAPDSKTTTCVMKGARQERRSRTCTPLNKSEKKRERERACSQSIELLSWGSTQTSIISVLSSIIELYLGTSYISVSSCISSIIELYLGTCARTILFLARALFVYLFNWRVHLVRLLTS